MRLVKISQHLRKAFAVMLPIFIIGCTRQQGRNPATPASLPFDRKTWIAQQAFDSETSPRWLMYDDLVNNHLPLGMTRAQVVELIGAGTVKLDNNMLLEEAGFSLNSYLQLASTTSHRVTTRFVHAPMGWGHLPMGIATA